MPPFDQPTPPRSHPMFRRPGAARRSSLGPCAAFSQVDVFSTEPLPGQPASRWSTTPTASATRRCSRFAHWTNLSETTFLLPPTDPGADYRLRIFTPSEELPFAGHPTLGSAHAWLEAGGVPRIDGRGRAGVRGRAGARVRRGERLAFAAPPVVREGPVTGEERDAIVRGAGARPDDDVVDARWIDNGPGWVGGAAARRGRGARRTPDWAEFGDLEVGVVGPLPARRASAPSRCARSARASASSRTR